LREKTKLSSGGWFVYDDVPREDPSLLGTATQLVQEDTEVTKIRKAIGERIGAAVEARPFRAPYHTVTTPKLVSEGGTPEPGKSSLIKFEGRLPIKSSLPIRRAIRSLAALAKRRLGPLVVETRPVQPRTARLVIVSMRKGRLEIR
jgi:hypothetical protein